MADRPSGTPPSRADDKKSHLYYGKITQTSVPAAAAVLDDGSNFPSSPAAAVPVSAATESPAAAAAAAPEEDSQHAERLRAFKVQQTAASFKTAAPTIDSEVRDALR
ncbi:U4/U6 small nuclear ribonucleoprotein, putative [Eimeria maxima]|uniref:U4/U6 small nuclear ribonucleoprotein, putative n=1 Tax=Eimeria maxima TaxID=5804 RepID=U6M917_EIMMA|nr:U4/U6 small nuclear ribonucleoprotein, putative [Eimeria maxima]CDJ60707.1 U4/U6 small nuclear ribonucleoprotein, putative [Eimeria maxima]